jgi:hypothetical protein
MSSYSVIVVRSPARPRREKAESQYPCGFQPFSLHSHSLLERGEIFVRYNTEKWDWEGGGEK